MEDNGALSPSTMVPLRMLTPGFHDGGSSDHRQLVVTPGDSSLTAITASRFRLPKGWKVKKVLRSNGGRVDKYYYEPGTSLKFRSIKEVERHIKGEEYRPRRKAMKLGNQPRSSGSRKVIISGGRLLRLGNKEFDQRELAVVTSATAAATSPFNLPDGWVVEEVPRKCHGWTDKYYYEPGTWRKFRSLKEVERHIKGEGYTRQRKAIKLGNQPRSSGSRRMVISGGRLLSLDNKEGDQLPLAIVASPTAAATSPFNLPDDWVVEEVPRKCHSCTDKYYYEPGTGQKFRSLVSVQRYLEGDYAPLSQVFKMGNHVKYYHEEGTGRKFQSLVSVERYLEEEGDNAPLSKVFKMSNHVKKCRRNLRRKIRKTGVSSSDSTEPPLKINWVLADTEGLAWNPFVAESIVPEPVKQEWALSFMQSLSHDIVLPRF